jgi:hypothetical protein
MRNFSIDQYSDIVKEIRERILSAEILSEESKNIVFIESTSLQIRKILELIAYLSVLANKEKLNHDSRNEYHAERIIKKLTEKTTIFYPFPSHIFPPINNDEQPILIPIGYKYALSQDEFSKAYNNCGEILHAQHPLKNKINIEEYVRENKITLNKLKELLARHTIGIKHDTNKYTFLHVEIDFTNNDNTKPSTIREYKTHIFDETQLKMIFSGDNIL